METKLLLEISPPNYGSQNPGTSVRTQPIEHSNILHTVTVNRQIETHSTRIECPSCRAQVHSNPRPHTNPVVDMASAVLGLFIFIWICVKIYHIFV